MQVGKIKKYQTTTIGLKDLRRHLESLYRRRQLLTEGLRDLASQNDVNNVMYDYAQTVNHSQVDEIESQISELQRILSRAVVVTPSADKVTIGSQVTIKINGALRTYTIVGYMEADPLSYKISDESPFGKALIGRKVGETFELSLQINNKHSATIVEIRS